ncbi:MAG: DUF1003 domain-containing protein [Acidimicrobiales bacterium]
MARRRDPAQRLATPAAGDRRSLHLPGGEDTFGRLAEAVARNLGTSRFLIVQTVLVVLWITFNVVAITALKFDPYPFILLNLAFSTQASYAAPLILLAQNRQEDRDRAQLERDRDEARRTQQDTEYLARELASIRIALADVVTAEDLERTLERVLDSTGAARKKAKKKKRLDEPGLAGAPGPGDRPGPTVGDDGLDDPHGPEGERDDDDEPASPS